MSAYGLPSCIKLYKHFIKALIQSEKTDDSHDEKAKSESLIYIIIDITEYCERYFSMI